MAFTVKLNIPELQLRRCKRDSKAERLSVLSMCVYVSVVYVFKDHLLYSSGAAALNNTVKDGEMIHSVWFLNENLSTAQLVLSSVW